MRDDSTNLWWWIRQVGTWLVMLAALALLAVMVVVPRVAGATPYTVATGSMRPTYPPGTLVVVKPVNPDDIGIGTVITFQRDSGQGTVVTHRVVGIRYGPDGEREFLTRGDANPAIDREPVRPIQLRGEVWYAVPLLGWANSLFTGRQHQLLAWVVAAGLGVYALVMFAGAAHDRRQRGRADGDRRSGPDARRAPT